MASVSPAPYRTEDFLVLEEEQSGAIEVWVDWVPAVDGVPGQPIAIHAQGLSLMVTVPSDVDEHGHPRPAREVVGLREDVFHTIAQKGLVWVVCGPSGVLGRSLAKLESSQ